MTTASMPMYDLPEVRPALDAFWSRIADNLAIEGLAWIPEGLTHGRPVRELWSDPDLLISQCCGFDLVKRYRGKLRPILAPRFTAPGCDGCRYCSIVVVSSESRCRSLEDLRGTVCVVNGLESHSGMNALRALVAPLNREGRFFSAVKASGGHCDSLAMVGGGVAEVAAIDCVTFALLRRHRPESVTGVRPLCMTASVPGIPFVTRADLADELVALLRAALVEALNTPELTEERETLMICGQDELDLSDYEQIIAAEQEAAKLGYALLR